MKDEYDFSKAERGAVLPSGPGKTRITIRIDDDVLDWFRQQADAQGGGNYQTMINAALREWLSDKKEPLEEVFRRILREELSKAS